MLKNDMSDLLKSIEKRNFLWNKKTIAIYRKKLTQAQSYLSSEIHTNWLSLKTRHYVIIETGFECGLNFLLAWKNWMQLAPKSCNLHFYSVENKPLSKNDLIHIFNVWPALKLQSEQLIESYPLLTPGFHQLIFEGGRVKLTLLLGEISFLKQLLYSGDHSLEKELNNHRADLFYFNSTEKISIELISLLSKPKCFLINQTAENCSELADYGFKKTTKNSLFIRTEIEDLPKYSKFRQTPWHINPAPLVDNKIIVIGGGLAGCFIANKLANRGKKVILIEQHSIIAGEGSGNPQAILYPKLSAYSSPFTQFMLSSYLYAHKFYKELLRIKNMGELNGIIQLDHNQKEYIAQQRLYQWLTVYPELGKKVDAEEILKIAGIDCMCSGMYLPMSGWIDMPQLCFHLVNNPNISVVNNHNISELNGENNLWHLNNYQANIVILANGYSANQYTQTYWLPLKKIPGQLTYITSTSMTENLLIPICGEGHLLPSKNNVHSIGATYHQEKVVDKNYDNQLNLKKLSSLLKCEFSENIIKGEWNGIRAATPDYLPAIGPVPDEVEFLKKFNPLKSDSKRWLPAAGIYQPGLYLFTGFGSRGLTTIPLAAEFLAALIDREPLMLPQNLVRAIAPSRFLIKNIVRKNKSNTC